MADAETITDAGVSEREAEVLALVAERATNAEIAARLFVSVRTVESHVSSLLRKLGVSDRRALARLADETARAAGRAGAGEGARTAVGERPGGGDDDGVHAGAPARPAGRARALPVPLTSFVGRTAEVAELTAAVETHRLVTTTGPGGVGKTRLATAVAAALASRRRDGAWFVDLMPVTDDALIATAVANTLGLGDVRGRDAQDVVMSYLADSDALLVLDNCEKLVAGAAVLVERLLSRCPHVSVLTTSQARLMLPFEWVVPVPGLSLPDGDGEGDAVALFVERARQAGTTVVADEEHRRIGAVCRRLDGSALAIELAAARLPSLGLDGIERGLTERLELLAGGPRVDERHQSLRSTIDWSYELLDQPDQMLLRHLALFAGAFTVDAATAVVQDDGVDRTAVVQGLARLTEHSLLVASPGHETRYRMLDTIRQYGIDKMAATATAGAGATDTDVEGSSELAVVGRRHLAWSIDTMAALDARADLPLAGALARPDDLASWRADFDHAADDARVALKRALHDPDLRSEALTLATLLADTSFTRGLLVECQRRYEQSAEVAGDGHTAAEMMMRAGGAAAGRQVGADTLVLWRRAADIAVAAGDLGVAAYALARSAELVLRGPGIIAERPSRELYASLVAEARDLGADDARADALLLTATGFELDEDDPDALAVAERAVAAARALDDPVLESGALDAISAIHLGCGDVQAAFDAVHRRIELLSQVRPTAHNAFEIADAYGMAAEIALTAGDFDAARDYADCLTDLSFHVEEGHLATSRRLKVDAIAGEIERVLADAERFRHGWDEAGRQPARTLVGGAYAVAMVHGLRGDDAARAEWTSVTLDLGVDVDRLEGCGTGYGPTFDAILALHHGDVAGAVRRLDVDPTEFRRWYTGEWRPWYAALQVEAGVLSGAPDARERMARARPLAGGNATVTAMIDRAAALADGDTERLVTLADVLAGTGCRYQWARTLVLAGGAHADEGRRQMAALGAAPMAEPPFA